MHVNPSQKLQDALSQVNNTVGSITAANDEVFNQPQTGTPQAANDERFKIAA
jgi:hypothetical protein